MQPDLEYTICGLFIRFVPNTPAGEDAWRVMAASDPVLAIHAKAVLAQLRAAGYSVTKAKPIKINDDELITELLA